MKIGMVGTGRMASALGRIWGEAGHEVFFGSRDPRRGRDAAAQAGSGARGGSYDEAARFGDVIVLAVPGDAAEVTARALAGVEGTAGRILVDPTNPLGVELGSHESLAQRIQDAAPDLRVVKAFNSIHFANLDAPRFGGGRAVGLFCGDDIPAKEVVRRLIADVGLDPVDSGPLSNAWLLEAAALLWIDLAFERGQGMDTALALLRREHRA